MATRRKICLMTGTRAEYGLLYWLMRELAADDRVDFQLVVSAMHLAPEFGETIKEIRADGFKIDAETPCLAGGDDNAALGKSMGQAVIGFVDAFDQLSPDLLILLGDRFECLAAASAATALRIPIGHLHGGETSEGAMDEAFRHAITKMSHLHFVAAPEYARRVVQLGEQPERVFNVGALGLENFLRLEIPDRAILSRNLGLDLATAPYFLLTYHPATLVRRDPVQALEQVLSALSAFPDFKIVATKANADPGGRAINGRLATFARENPGRVHLADSLGQARYLGVLRGAAAVIGNSSSGIIEAPAVDVPIINIGSRQNGRLKAKSVLDCDEQRDAITAAIARALRPEFRTGLPPPPYGRPRPVAERIAAVLRETNLSGLLVKKFYDLPVEDFSDGR